MVWSEWLLQEAVQLKVTGYEVNRSWWEGPNSIPHFIDISKTGQAIRESLTRLCAEFCDELEERSCTIPSDHAIMFCYFNNLEYFNKYLDQYKGTSDHRP